MRRKKSTVKPNLPKEYVWTLNIEGEEKIFKCLVTETEVITFEGDQEHKHLKIVDPTCMEGVLQIDTKTKIYGEMIEFQLERFIPYIRLEGHWTMSDTTEEDRLQEQIAIYKKQSKQEIYAGVAFLLVVLVRLLVTGDIGDWWMLAIFGVFFISAACMTLVRLKNEINAINEAKEAAIQAKAQTQQIKEKAQSVKEEAVKKAAELAAAQEEE